MGFDLGGMGLEQVRIHEMEMTDTNADVRIAASGKWL
jgi:hypothetical protein